MKQQPNAVATQAKTAETQPNAIASQTEVVAALILREGRFLICQRPKHKARALLWEFPGGKVEAGESKAEALVRECREELGVTVSVGELYAQTAYEYPDITVHLTFFLCTLGDGEPQRLEHANLKWLPPEELKEYAFCPADAELIRRLGEGYARTDRGK